MPSFGSLLAVIGALLLAHAAYSAYEHLAYLNAVDGSASQLPLDIVVECVASAGVALLGVILSANPFKDIRLETEMASMTIDKIDTKPSFVTFQHRKIASTHAKLERQTTH